MTFSIFYVFRWQSFHMKFKNRQNYGEVSEKWLALGKKVIGLEREETLLGEVGVLYLDFKPGYTDACICQHLPSYPCINLGILLSVNYTLQSSAKTNTRIA